MPGGVRYVAVGGVHGRDSAIALPADQFDIDEGAHVEAGIGTKSLGSFTSSNISSFNDGRAA